MKTLLSRSRKGALLAITAAAVVTSCGKKSDPSSRLVASREMTKSSSIYSDARGASGIAATSAPAPQGSQAPASAPPSADQVSSANAAAIVAPTMVIRNGSVRIEVDSLEMAIAATEKLVKSLGGYLGNTSTSTENVAYRAAELQLRIPSSRFDEALNGLSPIGKVEQQTSTAEDVGEEFFDVTARQANAKKLEERLITLLATRTGKLEDVLMVERELARVREEIERYEGRLRYLKSHVATSTLVLNLHEPIPVVGQYAGKNVFVESFKEAWRIFITFLGILISSLGWIIPLTAIGAAIYFVQRRFRPKPTSPAETKPDPNP